MCLAAHRGKKKNTNPMAEKRRKKKKNAHHRAGRRVAQRKRFRGEKINIQAPNVRGISAKRECPHGLQGETNPRKKKWHSLRERRFWGGGFFGGGGVFFWGGVGVVGGVLGGFLGEGGLFFLERGFFGWGGFCGGVWGGGISS